MRIIARFRRWLDRRRQPMVVYITPDQFRQMFASQRYRERFRF